VNSTVLLRSVSGPEILHRCDGYTVWHSGVCDGPHGLCLTLEVLDESGARRMDGEQWQSSTTRRWPLDISVSSPDIVSARPHEVIEARSPHYYRLICMFGKYGRVLGPRPAPDLQLTVIVHPLGVHVTRTLGRSVEDGRNG